jgi:trigger factor
MVALEFPVTEGELAAAEERAFRRLARNVRLPGFRKGKVPRKIFEQTYGAGAVTTEAVEEVVPEAYAKAIREHELQPVDRPKFEVVEENDGRPTRMKATVEVRPAIELHRYKGIAVSRPSLAVSDADVEQSLEALAKERATLVPVDRAARLGDVATIDYEGTVDGSPFAGGRGEGEVIELSEGRFVPGFATGIAGMVVGETKQVEAEFPPGYPSAELAGKPAFFAVTLRELKEPELPPLDDDFAKAISENQTVTQLREDIRRRLEAVAAGRGRRFVGNAVMAQLLATHDFPLPSSLVENEVGQLVEEASETSQAVEKSEAELRDAHRGEAESRVKAALLVQAIANAENIVATPADVTAELEALARRYGQPVARIRKALGNSLLSLMDGIVRNKTLDLLIDNAVVSIDQETPGTAS